MYRIYKDESSAGKLVVVSERGSPMPEAVQSARLFCATRRLRVVAVSPHLGGDVEMGHNIRQNGIGFGYDVVISGAVSVHSRSYCMKRKRNPRQLTKLEGLKVIMLQQPKVCHCS